MVESFAPEGPKITRHGGWYLHDDRGRRHRRSADRPHGDRRALALDPRAVGELLRTIRWCARRSADEHWWSRGHATLVEDPAGQLVDDLSRLRERLLDARPAGLLDPVEWTDDGWFVAGGDLSRPLRKPRAIGAARTAWRCRDDFSTRPSSARNGRSTTRRRTRCERVRFRHGALHAARQGQRPRDCSPLASSPATRLPVRGRDRRSSRAQGGAAAVLQRRLYAGLGCIGEGFVMHRYGTERRGDAAGSRQGGRLWLRVDQRPPRRHHPHSGDGRTWQKFDVQMEVSGYHHNVAVRLPELAARSLRGRGRRGSLPTFPLPRYDNAGRPSISLSSVIG